LLSKLSALKGRAENLSQIFANFDATILQEINLFDEENDLDLIENVQKELDNRVSVEEKKYEDLKRENEGVRENLKNKCLSLILRLEEKLSKKLFQCSKALYVDLKNSAIELCSVLNKYADYDSNNIESKLLELDKRANDGEHLNILESLHCDLIDLLSDSYCDNEFYNKTKQEVDKIYECVRVEYKDKNESLKMQMQTIKEEIIQNEKDFLSKEKVKKEGFKARCLDLKNSISAMISKRQRQS